MKVDCTARAPSATQALGRGPWAQTPRVTVLLTDLSVGVMSHSDSLGFLKFSLNWVLMLGGEKL